jgi:signal peptidase II
VEELAIVKKSGVLKYFILALAVILIDQTSKMLVQQYMFLGQEINLLTYADGQYGFKLHYLLNPGMAFGIKWDSEFGKLALTGFRIVAMFGIAYYLIRTAKKQIHTGFLFSLALILGGAVGNVIDSTFYGVWFNNQPFESPTPWFHGQVIDMLFFPLVEFTWPSWIPCGGDILFTLGDGWAVRWASWLPCGGGQALFFSPVFNIADSSIFIGVVTILIFQKKYFPEANKDEQVSTVKSPAHVVAPPSPESITMVPHDMTLSSDTPDSKNESTPEVTDSVGTDADPSSN